MFAELVTDAALETDGFFAKAEDNDGYMFNCEILESQSTHFPSRKKWKAKIQGVLLLGFKATSGQMGTSACRNERRPVDSGQFLHPCRQYKHHVSTETCGASSQNVYLSVNRISIAGHTTRDDFKQIRLLALSLQQVSDSFTTKSHGKTTTHLETNFQ